MTSNTSDGSSGAVYFEESLDLIQQTMANLTYRHPLELSQSLDNTALLHRQFRDLKSPLADV